MTQPRELLRGSVSAIREWFAAAAAQSERTILLGTILVASAISIVTGLVLARYYSVDVTSSLIIFVPNDCYVDWGLNVGRHCFSDYAITVSLGMRPNPWEPYPLYLPPDFKPISSNYLAAGMVPQVIFGFLGKWLGAPRLGLLCYLLALTIAVFTPAGWAARGAKGLERVVVFVTCGVAAIPVWVAIDRGNLVGFLAPIALVFLVALCRRRWGLVTCMVILAALVKPQFAVLAVALFVARQWRWSGIAAAGVAISNIAAYALWPRDFPETITQSIRATLGYGGGSLFPAVAANSNVSFGKGLHAIPDAIKAAATGGKIPDGFLAGPRSLIGYAVLVLVVVALLGLGPRIPPVMAGIVLLATASLFPALSNPYYLVFVLPIAALVIRDPDGPPGTGIFDRLASFGDPRRAVGMCVSLAAALCIAQIALPGPTTQVGDTVGPLAADAKATVVTSTVFLAPLLWLVACAAIIVSYARRSAPQDTGVSDPAVSRPIAQFSPQRPA
ncbi:DUF2029 domain-containing protein [Mycobacterium shinjukuense]|uniref:Membrane protein n=1 Tax=Mycobacterium shinjukuense TaxID=398694 RepID=A0A7I7MPC9_9MYCO|nr:glycosyltransferase family 87 protein [Mycobacterium shinjukuense]MCV6986646.1 DUF2029 domain-containing protein [Mycobacterium shinjukuense]ORB64123.1 hypothetical protein BST45_16640 [Mycobacterium shinjukuense]BBX73790.1 membrane protein [Mycobacterium shinjukuense]